MREGSNRPRLQAITLAAAMAVVAAACTGSTGTPTTSTTLQPTVTTAPLPPPTTQPATTTTTTTAAPIDVNAVVVAPEDGDLAALVAQSDPATKFVLLPGEHRTSEIAPKDGMVFEGTPGAILNGSQVIEGFETQGDVWVAEGAPLSARRHGKCVDDYEACALSNDLFMDNTLVWRVDDRDDVGPGTWWGAEGTIVVGDDPTQRRVELSVTEHAFISAADDVEIRGLVVEKFATVAQRGAIQAQLDNGESLGSGWLIEDVETRLNHAVGIKAGHGTVIRRVHSHHNGQLGIAAAGGTDVLVEDSEINNNNTRGFSAGWEAGGTKFTRTDGLIVRGNDVYDNLGPGLWTDIDCRNTIYENNVSHGNSGPGIFHEISYDALIRDNEVYDNGYGQSAWLWGAGILVAASSGVEVTRNVVYDNADGIAGIQQFREGPDGLWILEDLWVHNNEVTMTEGQTGVVQDVDDDTVFTERNLRFDNNTYYGATDDAFAWKNRDISWSEWNDAGLDVNGARLDE